MPSSCSHLCVGCTWWEQRELSFAGACSALMGEAEMGDLNGGFALQNQKRFYKQSCMKHKQAIAAPQCLWLIPEKVSAGVRAAACEAQL